MTKTLEDFFVPMDKKSTLDNSSFCYKCKKQVVALVSNSLSRCPDCNNPLWEEMALSHRKKK